MRRENIAGCPAGQAAWKMEPAAIRGYTSPATPRRSAPISPRGRSRRYCKLLCKRCALCVSRRRKCPQGAAGNALVARRHGGHGGDGHGSVYKSAGPAGDRHFAPRGAVDSGYPVLSMYLEPALQGCGRLSAGLDETKDGLERKCT